MTNEEFKVYEEMLAECDKEYFDGLDIQDEIAFNRELLDYLKSDDCYVEQFAEGLADFYDEHGYIVVNEEIVLWIIYQDDSFDYGSAEISDYTANRLVCAMYELEIETGDWEHSCSFWCIMAGFFDCDVDDSCYPLLQGYEFAYPDNTTPETKLMYSKFYLDRVLVMLNEGNPDYKDAFRILSHSDIRQEKLKSFAVARNRKAPEIHKELCRDTAITMYYLYSKLGDGPAGEKGLVKAGIPTDLETLEVTSSDCCESIEIANPLFGKEPPKARKKSGKSSTGRRRRGKASFMSKVKSTLRKIFGIRSRRKSNSRKDDNSCNVSNLQRMLTQYEKNDSWSSRFWEKVARIPISCLCSAIIGLVFFLFLKLFFSPGYLWWIISSAIIFLFFLFGSSHVTNEMRNARVKGYLDDTQIKLPSFIVLESYCISKNEYNWKDEYLVYFEQPLQRNAFHNPLRGHWSAQCGAGFEFLDTVVTFNYDENTAKILVEDRLVD